MFKTQNKYFWAGVLLYVVSFLLVAVGNGAVETPWPRGYHCAWYAFLSSFGAIEGQQFARTEIEHVSMSISGWINPVYLLAITVGFLTQHRSMVVFFRTAVILMMPFCWVVFLYEHLYPREGYVLWTAAMLLTMFSQAQRAAPENQQQTLASPIKIS